ncbi:L-fuculose-phosphate aldolase [Quadrisphaera granulorum]|uniref:L-fuculose-phosphate aldolase n=1 Tax=Quadrisphaera granulorum TaxID=317664 RepID=A0A316A7D9_9ACTN|nr:class II aldolase/adducin family protein [Quadrisphaera granulorum]PWJ53856.1 L-fuculose-phosphate aldolase [Quadrisphaera granulorum]SZE96613.1 L-fuculose-phosphate aldolase [Quadrisphaera granulorum]
MSADVDSVRAQVVGVCRDLAQCGLVKGSGGNVSARVAGGIAITGTGVVLADARPEDVTVVDASGRVIAGTLVPSSELQLHLGAYDDEAVGAVVHTHASASVALSLVTDRLPCLHYQQLSLGGEVPVVPFAVFGSAELAASVTEALADKNAVILAHHGAVTTGADLASAVLNTELLEWAADIFLRARAVAPPRELSEEEQLAVVVAAASTGYGTTRTVDGS